ncbi:carboxypeptidase regulatory-like domain-containing protein [bacterium]|nr:carboxypeptidase regulatory-like domain-containing protein [bacterium]
MNRSRIMFLLAALLSLTAISFAQVSQGGVAISQQMTLSSAVDSRALPAVDHAAMLAEDATESKDVPLRFGYPHDVNFNLANSGTWEDVKEGRVWRLRIESAHAYSINLVFDRFDIPVGATLFLYNHNHEYVIGSFTEANEFPDKQFATQPVPGDAITLEYFEPETHIGEGEISVMRVVHAYRDMFGRAEDNPLDDFNESGSCNNNVICPEGDLWQNQTSGVVMLLTSGNFRFCSGSLINNTANNATPYILTANHCSPSTTNIFMFNYESPTCANADGLTSQTVAGCQLLANSSPSDFYLVRLNSNVPSNYNPYFNGWNANDVASTNSVGIHHPSGDVKKISFDTNPTTSTSYLGTTSPGDGTHWRIATWEDGTTEGGSSGSPLFDQNHRITGQLHGGYASCSNNVDDYYGKLARSMTAGLRTYLDPSGSGVMTLDGYDPNAGGFASGTVLNATSLQPISGATVSVAGGGQTATTNASGVYTLALAPNTYTLAFSKVGYISDTTYSVVITFGNTTTANKNLVAMPVIAGTVTNAATSAPIPSATVNVVGGGQSTTTNASGIYYLSVPAGMHDVAFSKAGHLSDTTYDVSAAAGDTTTANKALWAFPITYSLNENFESGGTGWTHSSAGGSWVDDWHISTERSYSATHSYKCGSTTTGQYRNLNDARLLSPTINALPAGATLSFWMQVEAELSSSYPDSAYDGGILEISVNGGAFTRINTVPGYNKTVRASTTGPISGQPCWSGTITTWTQQTANLSAYAGSNIQLRFRFGTDNSVLAEGWYVDDVQVYAYGSLIVAPEELTIFVDGSDVILRWADDTNPFYKIYQSNDPDVPMQTLIDSTDQNTYTIVGGAATDEKLFYVVVGWDGN